MRTPQEDLSTSFAKKFFKSAGPGIVAGAADDDPSGVGTYSVAGAKFGTSLLWVALVTWPLMAYVQMMCARVGMVTGCGLSSALRKKVSKPVLIFFVSALFIANTLNIGADLAAMGDAAEMLSGFNSKFFILAFGAVITWATIKLQYEQIARILKWFALFLLSYVVVTIHLGPDWGQVLHDTLIPKFSGSVGYWGMIVALLGTTISPYLFFWQTSQEVEEEKAQGRLSRVKRVGATPSEILLRQFDVGVGTFASNFVMFFIILATALTLHRHGLVDIETTRQAAEALEPLAGRFASLLYTVGLLGVGFLAIPTLTASVAYSLADVFGWRQGLSSRFGHARAFYAVIGVSTFLGMLLDFGGMNPVKALYWSAVANGVLAPFLLVGVLLVAGDKKIMHGQPSSRRSLIVVGVTTFIMFAAVITMFVL